jgi:hypothetical protein
MFEILLYIYVFDIYALITNIWIHIRIYIYTYMWIKVSYRIHVFFYMFHFYTCIILHICVNFLYRYSLIVFINHFLKSWLEARPNEQAIMINIKNLVDAFGMYMCMYEVYIYKYIYAYIYMYTYTYIYLYTIRNYDKY